MTVSEQPAIRVIAEIANAHQGDPARAMELARAGAAAGASAVKFQIYFARELLVERHPRYEHFKKQSFAPDVWRGLLTEAKTLGCSVYCDIFGEDALELARSVGVDGYKLHASDLTNDSLLTKLADTPGDLLLSVGGATVREIIHALRLSHRPGRKPILLHGFQSYPTALEDSCLTRLQWLHELFGKDCIIGYADHISGDDPFAVSLPLMAIGAGARVIEKHMTSSRAQKGVDWYSSLEPAEFAAFTRAIAAASAALGPQADRFSKSEAAYRADMKKHWVARRALPAGHVVGLDDIVMKRVPDRPGEPLLAEQIVGRKLLRSLGPEEMIRRPDVAQVVWALPVARMKSARLPGKALLDIGGMPALAHLFLRLKQSKRLDRVVFCTTVDPSDDPLVAIAEQQGIPVYRGPVEDVLGRVLGAIGRTAVDIAIRVTGDDILVDPDYLDRAVEYHLAQNAEYTDLKALPSGTEVEIFDVALLQQIRHAAHDPDGTEYLTTYITDHRDQIRVASAPVAERHSRDWRLTLDTEEDYSLIRILAERLAAGGKPLDYRLDDIVDCLEGEPRLLEINQGVRQRQTPISVDTRIDWRRLVDLKETA